MLIPVISDIHAPYHNGHAVDLACKLTEAAKPGEIVHLGDGVDFAPLSKYDKNPRRLLNLQFEIDVARKINRKFASASGDVPRYYIRGNHEDRLKKYLWRHPEIAGLEVLELGAALHLKEDGWILNDGYDREYCGRRLLLTHGGRVSRFSAYSARMLLSDLGNQQSAMMGHTHRQGIYAFTGSRYQVRGYENGCLCSFDVDYRRRVNWQLGMSMIEIIKDRFYIEMIPFFINGCNLRAFWRGKEYSA